MLFAETPPAMSGREWRLDTGDWILEIGDWARGFGSWTSTLRALSSVFHSPLSILLLLLLMAPAIAHADEPPITVHYIGPSGAVERALELAPSLMKTERLAAAQVIVLNGSRLDGAPVSQIADAVRGGAGLLLIASPDMPDAALAALLGQPVETQTRDDAQTLQTVGPPALSWLERLRGQTAREGPLDLLLSQVNWRSAPQIRERSTIDGAGLQV
ncbi:MAG: hypothetical protein ACE5HA_17075, partial [Anaerolineae bacterium]